MLLDDSPVRGQAGPCNARAALLLELRATPAVAAAGIAVGDWSTWELLRRLAHLLLNELVLQGSDLIC